MNAGATSWDVVVVGGGAAGLSAALVLGRSRRRVLVLDDGHPRNAASGHVQGYLTRDGATPSDLLEAGRDEVRRYGVQIRTGRAESLLPESAPGWIDVRLRDGTTERARRVVVATGLRDELPDVPGLAERWGRDVLHCPYCHGWEVRDEPLVVIATTATDATKAVTMTQWSRTITLLLDGVDRGDLAPQDRARLDALGVAVLTGTVCALDVDEGDALAGVTLSDGRSLPCSAVVVQPRVVAQDALLVEVGAEVATGPFGEFVVTDVTGATGVPGIWATGNVTEPAAQVVMAAAAGYRAALAIDHDLILEDADRAVERARARQPR